MTNNKQGEMRMKNLALKLAKITAELGGIAKDGRNEHQKFDFISYEHLYAAVRPLLSREKVAIIPSVESVSEERYETNNGGSGWRTTVTMNETIIDADSGDTMTVKAMGSANDTGDKSLGKAITEADKRWLFKLFKVSSKDDVDPDADSPEPPKSKPRPNPVAAKTAPAPAPKPSAPAPVTTASGEEEHWCHIHNCKFLKKEWPDGGESYSHKIEGTNQYCREPKLKLKKASAEATAPVDPDDPHNW